MSEDELLDRLVAAEAAIYVLVNGGSVHKKSCYDEEGVDCWQWNFDDKDWTETGPHEDLPPIPEEMIEYVNSKKL